MSTYNVYLGNPSRMPYRWQPLVDAVHALFVPVLRFSRTYDAVYVRSTMQRPSGIQSHELLIYVVPDLYHSVVRANRQQFFENVLQEQGLHHDGLTSKTRSGLSCSEVYVNQSRPDDLALLIYHEAMHNKLEMGAALHNHRGLAGARITRRTRRRGANDRLMGRRLDRDVPQWLGGFRNARRFQRQADPIQELFGGGGL